MSATFNLEIDGAAVPFDVREIRGEERIDAPAWFEVACRPRVGHAERGALAEEVLTSPATLSWLLEADETYGAAGERSFTGIVDAVELGDDLWRVRLVARSALAEDSVNHRVFVERDTLAIVKEVAQACGLGVDDRTTRSLEARPQCVQAFESDLGFILRLCAEEGIAWFSDPADGAKLVLVDAPSALDAAPGDPLPVREGAGLRTGLGVSGLAVERHLASDKVFLRDWDFEHPALDLGVEAKTGEGRFERYEFRAGRYTDPGLGKTLARIRLEEARRRSIVLRGTTNHAGLAPGLVLSIDGAPGFDGVSRWLIVSLRHTAVEGGARHDDRPYEARFEAVPHDGPYRPARLPRATLGGLETLDVTGAPGSEIHPDAYGRIRAHFRWDRTGPSDDTSSFWIRTLQPPTSGGFFLPRVGWEVLMSFYHGSPDEPLELGRLYRATDPPPESLPGQKIKTCYVSRTTPGGGSVNGLVLDDTAGNEAMTFTASKDWNERTENDRVVGVTADDTLEVGANRALIVGQVHAVQVAGAQSYSVGANRTANVTANKLVKAGSESIVVGGARIFDIGGDQQTQCASLARLVGAAKAQAHIEQQSTLVSGASTVLVAASLGQKHGLSHSVAVGGSHTEEVGGVKMIKAKSYGLAVSGAFAESYASRKISASSDIKEEYTASASYKVGGAATFKGADVVVKAKSKIVIKASGATITITSGSIEIDADIKSQKKAKDKNDESYG